MVKKCSAASSSKGSVVGSKSKKAVLKTYDIKKPVTRERDLKDCKFCKMPVLNEAERFRQTNQHDIGVKRDHSLKWYAAQPKSKEVQENFAKLQA